MVKDKTFHKLCITSQSMHHMHYFDHMQIDRLLRDFYYPNCIYNNVHELISQVRMKFGAESSPGNANQQRLLDIVFGNFETLQKLKCLFSCKLISLGNDSRVNLFLDKSLSLLHHFSDEEDDGSCAVPNDIILSGC
jgi:hypothetical protein